MSRLKTTLLIGLAASAFGCSGNEAPLLGPLSDQTAFVNSEFTMAVTASDPDGDELVFDFSAELADIDKRAKLLPTEPGRAVFKWTPLAPDLGIQTFDFTADDGDLTTRQTIAITVSQNSEGSGAPIFVQPLGTGTTVDLQDTPCAIIPIVVEDPDSTDVTLAEEEPNVGDLAQDGDLAGTYTFCPTPEQVAADDRYTVTFSADDGSSKTLKSYLIVLRFESKTDCPGAAPVITHKSMDETSVNDIAVTAEVSDDLGIKYEPLLYYSVEDPGADPDVTTMTQLTMELIGGDMMSGTWSANIPNPVASDAPGTKKQLYYVIEAKDNDDAEGTCDHLTKAPDNGPFEITVENPGGTGGLSHCEDCSSDVQCGGDGDLCLFLDGDNHCFTACTDNEQCPTDYYCSFSEFTSVDGAKGRQCIPNDYKCEGAGGGSCMDDGEEDNDILDDAMPLDPGTFNLMSCPAANGTGDDEDWFEIDVSSDATVDVSISAGDDTDLDLTITDASGTVIEKSDSLSSNESVSRCLTPGKYYVHVYAWGTGENPYSLTYAQTSGSCSGAMCVDDDQEEDDDAASARTVSFLGMKFNSDTNAICSMDDDWYEVDLFNGETLHATLTFAQTDGSEDLDVYIYDSDSNNLTGCSEATPLGCDPANGQSGTSDESFEWPITESGTYYVVVHGWNGSENLYDICISYESGQCP